jgi:IS30 family transposase
LRKQNVSISQIAKGMGRNKGTVSRELKRNTGQRGYRYQQADGMAKQRHADKPKAVKIIGELKTYVTECLREHWSPEQISGRLKLKGQLVGWVSCFYEARRYRLAKSKSSIY